MAQGDYHIERIPLTRILERQWPGNPKGHNLARIKESLREFGFVMPGLWDEDSDRIVVGHGRGEALAEMKKAGEDPPERVVEEGDEWMVPIIRGLEFESRDEAEAYLLADNRLTQLGGWDKEGLAEMLAHHKEQEGRDLESMGWTVDEVEALSQVAELTGAEDEELSYEKQVEEYGGEINDPEEKLKIYEEGSIRQVVLYYPQDEYPDVIDTLDAIIDATDAENNTEAVDLLLRAYRNHPEQVAELATQDA